MTWVWNYCKIELRTGFLDKNYILNCNAYQAAVLLTFNGAESVSVDDLVVATGLKKATAVQVLESLVKAKLVIQAQPELYSLNLSELSASGEGYYQKLIAFGGVRVEVEQG